MQPADVDEVRQALADHEYLADEGLATAISLSIRLRRPLLLGGEAGVAKTEVAKVLSRWTGGTLIRLQCYEGIDASQAVYDWDYAPQPLHLRPAARCRPGPPPASCCPCAPPRPPARLAASAPRRWRTSCTRSGSCSSA